MWIARGVALWHRGSRCLSLSCLTTECCCPQICSNTSCFALGSDLRGIRRIIFLLPMALLALWPPSGAEVEAEPPPRAPQPSPAVENGPNVHTVENNEKWLERLHARIQCPWQRPQPVACTYPVSLAAPSARCTPVLRGSQNSSLRLSFLSFFFDLKKTLCIFNLRVDLNPSKKKFTIS